MIDLYPVRRALLSVSDKTGLIELGQALAARGVELLSTGGSAKTLRDAGLTVKDVADITGFPEMMDGRVKTLHPNVHGGLLALRDNADHVKAMEEHNIGGIDLLVVNLYPFEAALARGANYEEMIENIDIGGPAMIRASAKNHGFVATVVDVEDYAALLAELDANDGQTTYAFRQRLAQIAYARTGAYDAAVSNWMAKAIGEDAPRRRVVAGEIKQTLRYGENPHQSAAFYVDGTARHGVATAVQHQGKELSYNNINDTDAAYELVAEFDPAKTAAVAIIKHANPCGLAIADPEAGDAIASAHLKAHETDSVSAFGGVIAANRPVTKLMAEQVSKVFTEVIVAPDYESGALEVLAGKKNLRILRLQSDYALPARELRQISGGMLSQEPDNFANLDSAKWELVCGKKADAATMRDLEFAWRACRSVKSNAILLASGGAAVGIGMGQVNRLDSARLAVSRAGERASGSVAASDAFFPFADGLQVLIDAGISAVVQPGGSMRDEEVIAAAKEAGITMYFTGERHFFH